MCKIKLTLQHKKGDRNDVNNYRGIAQANTILKLFTLIINNRLQIWAESNDIFPVSQSGFRKNRSCVDNIYVLNSVVQFKLTTQKKGLYALLIDFKKAFDSVAHNILWNEIFSLGVNSKLVRVFKN